MVYLDPSWDLNGQYSAGAFYFVIMHLLSL